MNTKQLNEEIKNLKEFESETLIEELNCRGYSVYMIPTEPSKPPKEGEETFYVTTKIDGRVNIPVNAPINDFDAAKTVAEIEFSCNALYDCGVVEIIDSFVVNAEDSEGKMIDF